MYNKLIILYNFIIIEMQWSKKNLAGNIYAFRWSATIVSALKLCSRRSVSSRPKSISVILGKMDTMNALIDEAITILGRNISDLIIIPSDEGNFYFLKQSFSIAGRKPYSIGYSGKVITFGKEQDDSVLYHENENQNIVTDIFLYHDIHPTIVKKGTKNNSEKWARFYIFSQWINTDR